MSTRTDTQSVTRRGTLRPPWPGLSGGRASIKKNTCPRGQTLDLSLDAEHRHNDAPNPDQKVRHVVLAGGCPMRVDGEWVGVGKGVRITAPPPDPPLPARASPAWSPARLHERGGQERRGQDHGEGRGTLGS